ncbi:MAG TPA: hypothetical protein P5136_01550 [Methanofastidiosum sp.]|nr:hypothetical protein [Methanofastidiosum sp.]
MININGKTYSDLDLLLEIEKYEGFCSLHNTPLDLIFCHECPLSKGSIGKTLTNEQLANGVCKTPDNALREARKRINRFSPAKVLEAKLRMLDDPEE